MSVTRPRPRRLAAAGAALAGLLAAGVLSGCGSEGVTDKNGSQPRQEQMTPSPGLKTVVPSAHPSPPVTVSPYPSSSASAKRGDAQQT